MKEKLMAMYEAQMIDVSGLLKAVERGWVTIEDVVEIVGEDNALSFIMAAKLAEISNMCNAVIVAGVDIELGEESVHFNPVSYTHLDVYKRQVLCIILVSLLPTPLLKLLFLVWTSLPRAMW